MRYVVTGVLFALVVTFAAATGESDSDGDGIPDREDNCPFHHNPGQVDQDGDGVGTGCDNCWAVPNPSQGDVDDDSLGDRCDFDDGLAYLLFDDNQSASWQAEVGLGPWNAYQGDLAELSLSGVYTQAPGSNPLVARRCLSVESRWSGIATPGPGEVAFFLTTGFAGGAESSLGPDSSGLPRPNDHPCPAPTADLEVVLISTPGASLWLYGHCIFNNPGQVCYSDAQRGPGGTCWFDTCDQSIPAWTGKVTNHSADEDLYLEGVHVQQTWDPQYCGPPSVEGMPIGIQVPAGATVPFEFEPATSVCPSDGAEAELLLNFVGHGPETTAIDTLIHTLTVSGGC